MTWSLSGKNPRRPGLWNIDSSSVFKVKIWATTRYDRAVLSSRIVACVISWRDPLSGPEGHARYRYN
jgi:hypothetical protein